MSKFRKKKKETPVISTASLPDIVFMLLFFFMVATSMRDTDLLIKKPELPTASEVKKLERRSLVSTIYVGKSNEQIGSQIQVNDKIIKIDEIAAWVLSEREKHNKQELAYKLTSIKADKEVGLGIIMDIKEELRKLDALNVSFSALKDGEM
jgi:biopolymer transport protein ExbD